MKVFEAVIHPHSAGFGMWQVGEWTEQEEMHSLPEWVYMALDNGYNVREATEIDGKIYGQDGAKVYTIAPIDRQTGETDEESRLYFAVRVE